MKTFSSCIFLTFLFFFLPSCHQSEEKMPKSQTTPSKRIPAEKMQRHHYIYVPVYSSIYTREEKNFIHLTATLSIRNTSLKHSIVVKTVDYHDTNGKLVKKHLEEPFSLGPLATKDFVVREWELAGGTGANFIVEWGSERQVSTPVIEAVMISSRGSVGISFICSGVEIKEE